jgi:N-methylhydantoinase B
LGLLIDLIIKALSEVLPDKVAAAHFGDSMLVSFFGRDPDGDGGIYSFVEATVGGWGGFDGGDGETCLINAVNGDFKNQPVEFLEQRYPLIVKNYRIRKDSEGAGMYRGGFGVSKEYVLEGDEGTVFFMLDRSVTPAWGLAGGQSAAPPYGLINPETPEARRYNKRGNIPIKKGDVIRINTGGGGGYGDPLKRDRKLIENDLSNGLLSMERAQTVYGYCKSPNKISE